MRFEKPLQVRKENMGGQMEWQLTVKVENDLPAVPVRRREVLDGAKSGLQTIATRGAAD